ncbi:anhydro-N-acetylmuramic acid kinase [Paenibacillus swuensis]|uniref:Anhydro-N-acetylmuramic acid kinase n=1 Tax=Paenibacillus swuensis TaxID=1178515 RepID=A0A172TQ80_9BACL|nr:anhydro-N-acetylmuramic acid kinase [Paenibacillus swuensis]
MSGTSLDGIDAAVVRIEGQGIDSRVELLHFLSLPYTEELREKLKELCSEQHSSSPAISGMSFYLAQNWANAVKEAVRQAGLSMADIDLVSSHGQTIWHMPYADPQDSFRPKSTLQIGDLSVLAKATGVLTVGDFRPADMAVGGQGAPLTPYADYIMFRHKDKGRILQNIGGISNCASIPAGAGPERMIAFDTGPGNMIIDQAAYELSGGQLAYDQGGAWASEGRVDERLLAEMMEHPYLSKHPVKTTGREEFGKDYASGWILRALSDSLPAADIMATFTAFTARTIARSYRDFILPDTRIEEVLVSGGGAHNETLMNMLADELPELRVMTSDQAGISADGKEAVAFAIFADHYIQGVPNNLTSATGAQRPTVMGKLALPW